ncbi:MAG: acetate--CoA ligase family protein [Deltaproteobacteria bacterium]|nr:acetate--CoA ligase family protein [Deltaproteobacteria bacterium]
MEAFFNPRGIALIGASAKAGRGGYRILKNLMAGFKGGIYPVNPGNTEIEGLRCYRSVLEVPDPVDLAIVFVPAARVPAVVRECVQRGIGAAIIESGGFAETGEEGKALQAELVAIHRETGIRLWGPNCMGLVDAARKHAFSFVMEKIWAEGFITGKVSLVTQSGFLAAGFLIDLMSHASVGIAKACSIGNKVDVDECDLLEYLIDDPHTGAIGMYLESIRQGRRFVDLCRSTDKPIVVLKGGKSASGARAAMSHTASLAGNGALVGAALAQAGVVEAEDFHQMMDVCEALASYPNVAGGGGRVAVLTPSGGAGIVCADFIDRFGLCLARFSPATRVALAEVFPPWMPAANPVDVWPALELHGPDAYRKAFDALCDDPEVDAILCHFFALGFIGEDIGALAGAARAAGKPLFCWIIGTVEVVDRVRAVARAHGVPIYRELRRAVECMAAVLKRRPRSGATAHRVARDGARRDGAVACSGSSETMLPGELAGVVASANGALDEHLSKRILAACGIAVVEESVVASAEQAAARAAELGWPVVMKGLVPGQVHKTEMGLVRLGIATPEQAAGEFTRLDRKMNGAGRVLVQRQLAGELELIAGLVRDPQFGPCVMFGLGGVMAEILRDTSFALAPLGDDDALALIARLESQRLLDGFRGAPAVDRQQLAGVLVRLGALASACPRIREIDVNPLIVSAGRAIAVDASVILGD